MKKVLVCLCMMVAGSVSFGKPVDENTAQTVAYNYYKSRANVQSLSDLSLAYTATSQLGGMTVNDFYIFNLLSGTGFIIVSADDIAMPVLGYSTESNFTTTRMSPEFQYMLDNYKNQIAYGIQTNAMATPGIVEKWGNLKTDAAASRTSKASRTTSTTIGPLLLTIWDQENEFSGPLTYNADCPYDSLAATPAPTVTGCVATAMAQVMKYWNWPDTGVGTNTYTQNPNPDHIPAQTANFAIAYHFDSMPKPRETSPNTYVAKLMYFAGVSVDMDYGTDAEDGSGAYVTIASLGRHGGNCAEYALKTYFRYPGEVGYERKNFTQAEWLDSMINEVRHGRPVIYAGSGSAGGHCWVMDGVDTSNDSMFHFNWGWSGNYDGFFSLNDIVPPIGDTFNDAQQAIIRIMGDTTGMAADTAKQTTPVKTAVAVINTTPYGVTVYPNPATNVINVSFEGITVAQITVTDIEGREMQQLSIDKAAATNKNVSVPVSELPDGVYLLRVQTDQGMVTRKFVVAK